jgi:transposase-like protein
VTTVIGTTDEACPYCGDTLGVAPTPGTSPRVKAWSCTLCRTDWAITVVNSQPYFDRLAATVELAVARSVLRQVITLADDAAMLSDKELRDRLLALASDAR